MAHRYWRATFTALGGAEVELTEAWLLDVTTRIDGSATLTSSTAPLSGTLAELQDSNVDTGARFASDVTLTWTFASDVNVTDIRLGAAADASEFVTRALIEWSDDGAVWSHSVTLAGILWPGVRSLTESKSEPLMVRDIGTYTAQQATAAVDISVVMPQVQVEGDLLVAVWLRRSATVSVPDGFQKVSESPTATWGSGGISITDVYVKKARIADSGQTITFTQASSVISCACVFLIGAKQGIGSVQYETSQAWSGVTHTFVNLPAAPSVSSGGSLAIGVGSNSHAATGSNPTSVSPPSGWTSVSPSSLAGLRLYVAGKSVFEGDSLTGAFTTNMGSVTGAGTTSHVLVFESLPAIVRSPTSGGTLLGHAGAANTAVGAVPPSAAVDMSPSRSLLDYNYDRAARGRIVGTVKRKGSPDNVPVRRRVRLYRDRDGMLIRETWSDPYTGAYQFDWVEEGEAYTALAHDYQHVHRAVAADNVSLAAGTLTLIDTSESSRFDVPTPVLVASGPRSVVETVSRVELPIPSDAQVGDLILYVGCRTSLGAMNSAVDAFSPDLVLVARDPNANGTGHMHAVLSKFIEDASSLEDAPWVDGGGEFVPFVFRTEFDGLVPKVAQVVSHQQTSFGFENVIYAPNLTAAAGGVGVLIGMSRLETTSGSGGTVNPAQWSINYKPASTRVMAATRNVAPGDLFGSGTGTGTSVMPYFSGFYHSGYNGVGFSLVLVSGSPS